MITLRAARALLGDRACKRCACRLRHGLEWLEKADDRIASREMVLHSYSQTKPCPRCGATWRMEEIECRRARA